MAYRILFELSDQGGILKFEVNMAEWYVPSTNREVQTIWVWCTEFCNLRSQGSIRKGKVPKFSLIEVIGECSSCGEMLVE